MTLAESTHRVEVLRLTAVEPHPNADRMEVARVWGYTCCVGKGQFRPGDLVAYVPPDSIVDVARSEFSFLGDHKRIRVKKLRGVISQGLLLPAPAGSAEGDDVAAALGVTHYEPPLALTTGGEAEPAPPGYFPKYDVEAFNRYGTLFRPGEPVVVTEKIHGASARYVWHDGRLRVGSRTEWKRPAVDGAKLTIWHQAAAAHPEIESFCRENPRLVLYGEVYGQVQDLKYGVKSGVRFAAFDILRGDQWLPHAEARRVGSALPWVPTLYEGPFDEAAVRALAEGPSSIPGADCIREGCVVKPAGERTDLIVGRVQLKIVSNDYLSR